MNIFDSDRDVLPIWVSSNEAAKLPELNPINTKKDFGVFVEATPAILAEFEHEKSVGVAIELLNSAIVEGRSEVATRAAEYLLAVEGLPVPVQHLVGSTLGIQELTSSEVNVNTIARLRTRIRSGGRDPLAWVDLSREYAILGEKERSQKAMLTALQLADNHRWVTRVASRAFIHFKEPDKAYSIISKNPNLKIDPWLIATEMAVARKAERSTKLWNIGKRFLESNIKPFHVTELASSVATNELLSGADKKARPFFKQSLLDPNQNSLAQAKWAERTSSLKNLVQVSLDSSVVAHEAKYWEAYSNKDMLSALRHAKAWFAEEPFSSNPPIAISYLAAMLDDYEEISAATRKGLKANPDNTTLKLNYIFGWLATSDLNNQDKQKVDSNIRMLSAILHGEDKAEAAHAMANIGMFFYRIGRPEDGKARYDAAEEYFEKNYPGARLMLLVNHLREALIAEAPWTTEILKRAKELVVKKQVSTTPGAEFYLEKIGYLSNEPGSWKEKFGKSQSALANEKVNRLAIQDVVAKRLKVENTFWLPPQFGRIDTLREFTESKKLESPKQKKN